MQIIYMGGQYLKSGKKPEELSNFNEGFIKNDENGNIGYFLEVDIDYAK